MDVEHQLAKELPPSLTTFAPESTAEERHARQPRNVSVHALWGAMGATPRCHRLTAVAWLPVPIVKLLVTVLLDAGADPRARDLAEDATPLEWAEYYRDGAQEDRSGAYATIAEHLRSLGP